MMPLWVVALVTLFVAIMAWWHGWTDGLETRRRDRVETEQRAARRAAMRDRVDANRSAPDDVTVEGEAEAPGAYAPAPSLDDAAHARFVVLKNGGLVLRLVDGEGRVLKEYEWGPARTWLLWRAYARTRRRPMGASSEGEEAS